MTLTIHTFKDRESLFKNEHIFVKLKFAIQIDKLVFTLKKGKCKATSPQKYQYNH